MKNAIRAMRLALRYPFRLAASIGLSFCVAIIWGGNIAAVYPILEVALKGKSMQTWVDEQIALSTKNSADAQAKLATLDTAEQERREQNPNGPLDPLEARARQIEHDEIEAKLFTEQNTLRSLQKMRPYIFRWLPNDPFQTIIAIVVSILVTTVIKSLCLVLSVMLTSQLVQKVTHDLRDQFARAVLRTDLQTFSRKGTSEFWTRFVEDIPRVGSGLSGLFGRAVGEPLKMLSCLVGAALINWRLLLVSCLLAPLMIGLVAYITKRLRKATRTSFSQDFHLNHVMFETLQGLQMVQAFTMEEVEHQRLMNAASRAERHANKVVLLQTLSKPAIEVLGIVAVCMALAAGAHLVLNHQTHIFNVRITDRPLSFTVLLVFYGMLVGACDPLRRLSDVFVTIQQGFAAAERLFPIIDQQPLVFEPAVAQPLPTRHTNLVFENIRFGYHAERPILDDVNLHVRGGETIAIVGPNGCGKTTLANMVPRFFDPDGGNVRIDGVDVRDCHLLDLRKRIGVVTQNTPLFDDTVFNNIRYGNPAASADEVIAAARKAHAHEFIEHELPNSYQTTVGQSGCRLSGGQRQRVALARAILRDPDILILDEPTSQVDLQSEQLIRDTLIEFVRGRTVILITHRHTLLDLAERIVVMNSGRILDIGTYQELNARCPFFRELSELHYKKAA